LTAPANEVIPLPNFSSQNPNIDQTTFLACQEGQLVEQEFTTGQYAPGTSAQEVQTDLIAQFNSAQTSLNSTNPPVANLVGSTYDGSSWSTPSPTAFFLRVPTTMSMAWAASFGRLPGVSPLRAAGYTSTNATTNTAVRATAYTPPGANGRRSLVSTNANDTAAGTGARTATITYLDSSFVLHTETLTLNGTNAVNTVGQDLAYIESIVVASVGSSGVNLGTINLWTGVNGTGSICGSVLPQDQQTWWAHHYVPAGVTCYLLNVSSGSSVVGGATILLHQPSLAAAGSPTDQIGSSLVHGAPNGNEHKFDVPLAVPGPDLVWVVEQAFSSTASKVYANFEYLQF